MSTEVERYEPKAELATTDPTGGRLVSWAHAMHAAKQLGDALSNTSFVPKDFRGKPDDAAAAIMYGDEIGFTPGQSLQNIYVIGGKPSLYARAMVALVLSKGHEIWTEASSPQRVIVCGKRRGSQKVERVEWTKAKADQAGYTSNKKYQTDPEAMLYARASGDVARRIAPDALAGIGYTVEELELGVEPQSVTVTREAQPKRTAKRVQPQPEPELDEHPQTGGGEEPSTPADRQDGRNLAPAGGDAQQVDSPPSQPPANSPDDVITGAQLKMMGALMNERGLKAKHEALEYVSNVVGRQIESRNDLSKGEASAVIDALKNDTVQEAEPEEVTEPELDSQQELG